jgi:hypothetical protein
MLCQETIDFEIKFTSIYWDQPPEVCVLIDNEAKFRGAITDQITVLRFSHTLQFDQPHCLTIIRSGKTDEQVKRNQDGTLSDQALVIEQIKVDGIDIKHIIYTNSYNEPIYPKVWARAQTAAGIELEKYIPAETYLGHNCTWRLAFNSPFYQFIMDKMHG